MMLLGLLRKDFLIVKKYVLLMFVVTILIPLFMLWRVPEYAGAMGFVLSVIFAIFMLMQSVSLKENQYPKATTLLCATPYPRKLLVVSKYVFCILIFIVCCLIFGIETLIFSGLGTFSYKMPIAMFLIISLFFGIYLPVQYKLGYEKTKIIFVIVIMASPFVFPQLLKMQSGFSFDFLNNINPIPLYIGILAASLIIFAVSAYVSILFYNKVDLD